MPLPAILRRPLRAPGYFLAVLLLAAAAVALNATAFGAWWALHWKALPYADADGLVELRIDLRDIDFQVGLSNPLYREVRAASEVFAGAVGTAARPQPVADDSGRSWLLPRVTGDFGAVLGVQPLLGRPFSATEADGSADAPVLLLSERAWRDRYGADPGVLGRSVRLAGREHQVIGVMPRGFAWPDAAADGWIPYVQTAAEREQVGAFGDLEVAARLAPDATVAQARATLAALLANSGNRMLQRSEDYVRADVRRWRERYAGAGAATGLQLLQLAALLLWLVALANLAHLVLDRMLARRHELALCRTLGARRADLLRAVATELLPPLLAGAMLGLLLASSFGMALLRSRGLLPDQLPVVAGGDVATLLAGLAVVLLLGAGTLLAAALALGREAAVAGGASHTRGTAVLGRGRATILVLQVAASTLLLGGTGLLLRSAWNLLEQPRGFEAAGVLLTQIEVPATPGASAIPLAELQRELASLPGVVQVALADMPPFGGAGFVANAWLPGQPEALETASASVGPGYFATLGIPLQGREFSAADAGDASPVIVDDAFVQRWLGAAEPLGATVQLLSDPETGSRRAARIVGVARTVRQQALDEAPGLPLVYQLLGSSASQGFLVTRASTDPAALALAVQQRIAQLAPDAVVALNQPLAAVIERTLVGRRALFEGVALYALATLLLAGLGLYAVLGAAARRRTAEIGVRLALGGSAARILRLVLGQGALLVGAGLLLGLLLGPLLAGLLGAQLYQLAPTDLVSWLAAALLVGTVALLACWLPARRATRVQPRIALQARA